MPDNKIKSKILQVFGVSVGKDAPRMKKELTKNYLTKSVRVKPSEDTPRGRAFADEETRLRQRQIDVQGEIQRENDRYARERAETLRKFGIKED